MKLEGLSLDQLKVVLAVVEEGSFSAAARRFNRAQSAVSYAVQMLEEQLGLTLFDRSGHRPRPTEAARSLLGEIDAIVSRAERLRGRARSMATGLEPELGIVIDIAFPMAATADLMAAFRQAFPGVPARLHVDRLGGVQELVLEGQAAIGVGIAHPDLPPALVGYRLRPIRMVPVAAPDHPLARADAPLARATLETHVQLVLSDRTQRSEGQEFFVLSPQTWRIADLGAKQALLRRGVGWGRMPAHMVAADLAEGRLVRLAIDGLPPEGDAAPLVAFHHADRPIGPAGTWLLERIRATA